MIIHIAGIYLTCTMAITTLAMVATVFVLNLYGMKEKPVPLWAKKVFVIYMARILCMCDCSAIQEERDDAEARVKNKRGRDIVSRAPESVPLRKTSRDHDVHLRLHVPHEDRRASASGSSVSPLPGLTFVPSYELKDKKEDKDASKQDYTKDWVHVAVVFDRLFFWLCLLFILITTLLLFHPLTTSKYFSIPKLDKTN